MIEVHDILLYSYKLYVFQSLNHLQRLESVHVALRIVDRRDNSLKVYWKKKNKKQRRMREWQKVKLEISKDRSLREWKRFVLR